MRYEYLEHHLNRRQMLGGMAKAGALGAAAAFGGVPLLGSVAGAEEGDDEAGAEAAAAAAENLSLYGYDDSFSIEGALNGEWAAATSARYGPEDERGTINEITPEKTARALAMLRGARRIDTFNLGHFMTEPFPAFITYPPRVYSQRIMIVGFAPRDVETQWFSSATGGDAGVDEWRHADRERGPLGYLTTPDPLGPNLLSYCEERFLHGGTYQIGTQFDHLNHIGVGEILYNGWRATEIIAPKGFTRLGVENVGPFVTRGILIDVLSWKKAQRGGQHVENIGGHEVLARTYRITISDLRQTMRWQGIRGIAPGDVVLIRTGWHRLAENPDTHDEYLTTEPGIHIAEAKWLGDHLPALIGSDAWGLEVAGNPAYAQWAFPVHQELIVKRGIHIGEGIITDALAEQGIYRFVYSYTPQNAVGATGGNTPPMALAQSRHWRSPSPSP